jgi:pimeloyl-ACP methyl ester carboxylesterase
VPTFSRSISIVNVTLAMYDSGRHERAGERTLTPARITNRVVAVAIIGVVIGLPAHLEPLAEVQPGAVPASTQAGRTAGSSARQDVANLPGVRLWFTDSGGDGEPIVLLHANTGTSEIWEPQVAAFSRAGYRVIAFDRRGWGRSEADPATGVQPGHVSEDLHALADFLSLKPFHLVGVAGGGFVALDYAAWHPDRVSSLVVGASTGSVSDREIQDFSARIEIPGIRSLPAHYREVSASYRGASPEGTKRWIEIEHHARQANAPAQPLRSPNTFAKLGGITARTLVVAADADLLAPPALMRLWAQHIKGAQWATVPNAGHAIAWEQPAVFNDIVLKFLKGGRPFPGVP